VRRYISHLTSLAKPDIKAFKNVIDDIGCPADEIMFFDDNHECIDSANNAGLQGGTG
jgi:HAD superfamily hydrolase (TIGR01509 family)